MSSPEFYHMREQALRRARTSARKAYILNTRRPIRFWLFTAFSAVKLIHDYQLLRRRRGWRRLA